MHLHSLLPAALLLLAAGCEPAADPEPSLDAEAIWRVHPGGDVRGLAIDPRSGDIWATVKEGGPGTWADRYAPTGERLAHVPLVLEESCEGCYSSPTVGFDVGGLVALDGGAILLCSDFDRNIVRIDTDEGVATQVAVGQFRTIYDGRGKLGRESASLGDRVLQPSVGVERIRADGTVDQAIPESLYMAALWQVVPYNDAVQLLLGRDRQTMRFGLWYWDDALGSASPRTLDRNVHGLAVAGTKVYGVAPWPDETSQLDAAEAWDLLEVDPILGKSRLLVRIEGLPMQPPLAVSADGERIAVGVVGMPIRDDETIRPDRSYGDVLLFDSEGNQLARFPFGEEPPFANHPVGVEDLAFTPDGSLLYVATDEAIRAHRL